MTNLQLVSIEKDKRENNWAIQRLFVLSQCHDNKIWSSEPIDSTLYPAHYGKEFLNLDA